MVWYGVAGRGGAVYLRVKILHNNKKTQGNNGVNKHEKSVYAGGSIDSFRDCWNNCSDDFA